MKLRKFIHGDRIKHKFRGAGTFRSYTSDSFSCVVTFDSKPGEHEEVTLALVSPEPKQEGIHKL